MIENELAPWVEKYPTAPEGWEPLATLPIKREALVEYLRKDGTTDQDYNVTNLQFVARKEGAPIAWREVTSGPLYDWWLKHQVLRASR